jgi:hypothetical protein
MTSISAPEAEFGATPPSTPLIDTRPPGDRYFRHPGDVVRLVVWGLATAVLAVVISLATSTTDGASADLGRAAPGFQRQRELALAIVQVASILVPVVVVVVLVVEQRWRRLLSVGSAVHAGLDSSSCSTRCSTSRVALSAP